MTLLFPEFRPLRFISFVAFQAFFEPSLVLSPISDKSGYSFGGVGHPSESSFRARERNSRR